MMRTALLVAAIVLATLAFFWLKVPTPSIIPESPAPVTKTTPDPTPSPKIETTPKPTPRRSEVPFAEQFKTLPRKEEIKKASKDELHHGPPGLARSAQALGDVMSKLKSDPSQIPAGIAFYERCARDNDILTSVRAVCFRNLKHFSKNVSDSSFPEDVVRISESLPPLK